MSLGSMITKARKDAGLSIEDLSAATNVRAPLLREIELNNFSNCGGETYARGHIRNIASKLGVEPEIFIAAFEDEQMHVDRSMQDLLVENSVMREPAQVRKVSWKVLVAISMTTLFLVALAQIIISNNSSSEVPVIIENSQSPTSSAQPQVEQSQEPTPEIGESSSTGEGVEVLITASRAKSWLFVSDGQGRTLFSGQLSQGSSKRFSADQQINLKIGNAGGVELEVNGESLGSLGADGEVINLSFGVDS